MVSVHCVNLLEYVTKRRASYFDTGFVSEMRLTTLSLIHYFVAFRILATSLRILETSAPDAAVLPPGQLFPCFSWYNQKIQNINSILIIARGYPKGLSLRVYNFTLTLTTKFKVIDKQFLN